MIRIPEPSVQRMIESNTLWIGSIPVPKMFLTWREGKEIIMETEKFRIKRMGNRSPNEVSFRDEIGRLSVSLDSPIWLVVEEEVPLFIEDRELWFDILKYFNIPTDSSEYSRCFFQTDFLFPHSSVVFEVDSDYHNGKEDSDRARDKYLWMKYGIETVRVRYYTAETHKLTNLLTMLEERYKGGKKLVVDHRKTMERFLEHRERDILKVLEGIQRYTDSSLLYSGQGCALTMKDLFRIGWVSELRDHRVSGEMMRVVDFVQQVYDCTLYIHGSSLFTTQEVIDVVQCNDPWERWKGEEVPGWVVGILGKPPKGIRYNNTKGTGQSREFLRKLKDLGLVKED